jgi:glycerophosphoryl diester phosphodiesterase
MPSFNCNCLLLLGGLMGMPWLLAAEPLVIAHRGASGYLPEHTLESKVLAFAQGADFIEQDVVMTRDDHLVVIHDLTLERTTDVAALFPGRARADGSYYVIDFTLEELRQLAVSEGRRQDGQAAYPQRFPVGTSRFGVHTLEEELELIRGLEQSTGRRVGIYPELKSPWFHHQHGKDLASAVLRVLRDHGYRSAADAVFLQSFDHAELRRVHDELLPALGLDLPLVQLIAENEWRESYERGADGEWRPADHTWMRSAEGLRILATVVDGVGPAFAMLLTDPLATTAHSNDFVRLAHDAGLLVHPYTFRRESAQLPPFADSLGTLLQYFLFDVGVDGVFTDFPDLAVQARDTR